VGRKPIIMIGCLLAAVTYFPIFTALTQYANPAIFEAQAKNPVTVVADPAQCSFQFDPVGKAKFTSSCDIAKSAMAKRAISYKNQVAPAGTVASIKFGDTVVATFEGTGLPPADFKAKLAEFDKQLTETVKAAGYPTKADPEKINTPVVLALLTILVIYVTMVYGPIAAWLVELFPTRIRYTSMSLPYHIGNGWVWRFPADHRLRHGGGHRRYLLWAVVSDRCRADDGGTGHAVPARDEGPRHP